jgi:hypothetical protein
MATDDEIYTDLTDQELRDYILAVSSDAMLDFLHYNRKEDDVLGRGTIEDAIKRGVITVDEILQVFREALEN